MKSKVPKDHHAIINEGEENEMVSCVFYRRYCTLHSDNKYILY